MDTSIPIVISFPPPAPKSIFATSAAGVGVAPSSGAVITKRYATFIRRYTPITSESPPTIAFGRSLPGFFISPAMAPTFIQPSYANIIPMSAEPRLVANG